MNEHLVDIARRFPLVPRPRPAPLALRDRLAEVADLAATPADHPAVLARTAAAYNRAALIASDIGRPELARSLCWRHHDRYHAHRPWTARYARLALEPVVNLARLHSRAGRPDDTVRNLESLLCAIRRSTTAEVDGRSLDLGPAGLVGETARAEMHRWLWNVALAEGIRALARVGRFDDALAHAHRYRGVGTTLLDGRQIEVIVPALHSDGAAALVTLRSSEITTPWERAVAACLEAWICAISGDAQNAIARATKVIVDYRGEPRLRSELQNILCELTVP